MAVQPVALVLAGHKLLRDLYVTLLAQRGVRTELAGSSDEAASRLSGGKVDLLVLDVDSLTYDDPWGLVAQVRAMVTDTPMLVCIGPATEEPADRRASLGTAVVAKPFRVSQFFDAVDLLLGRR